MCKFSYFLPRYLNQDALENFLLQLEHTPNVGHFISLYKCLLVSNFMTRHSPEDNCGNDSCSGALDNMECFLSGETVAGVRPLNSACNISIPDTVSCQKKSRVAACTISYFAGYVARKALRINNKCCNCRAIILSRDDNANNDFIAARQYENAHLIMPGGTKRVNL
jgi:hypothetical protein